MAHFQLLKSAIHMNLYKKTCNTILNQTAGLCTSQAQLSHRNPIYRKRALNPFLYEKDKKGRVKKLKPPGGKKNIPFDRRFPVSLKDVSPTKWGGHQEVMNNIRKDKSRFPHPPGYYDENGKFHLVKEMIPEFVVPDLTDFKLKPYVSYKVGLDVNQSEFTAKDLFQATYGKNVVDRYADGKIENLDKVLESFINEEESDEDEKQKINI